MPFFDFHCHPGLKPQFSNPAQKPSPWEYLNAKLAVFADVTISINKLFNEVLNSQSNLTQLLEADVKLIGVILHAPEQKIGQSLSEKKIVNRGSVTLIDKQQLQYLRSGIHSFELINTELQWLQTAPSPAGKMFKLIRKAADYKENAANTVFGIIIVEGLHCFFNDPYAPDAKEEFTQNFLSFTAAHTVLAINICHMQQNHFCNHAHGIQFFNPSYFYPTRTGITPWGREVIQLMIDRNILTDIKHMSLKARIELYTWFNENGDDHFIQPIICTHAGTTGLSISERVKYLYKKPENKGSVYEVTYLKPRSRHDDATYHNCSSINLYDEDIVYILRSGGIIGLSFDQRILGFADENVLPGVTVPHDVEYISQMEAGFFLGPNPSLLAVWPGDSNVWAAEDFENLDPSLYIEMHRRFLINNIIHILWVAFNHPDIDIKKAATQICIGTDFDGLINAIDCCKECTDLQQLKEDMKEGMVNMLEAAGLDGELGDADMLLNNIFYTNGKKFVLNRVRLMSGT
jgi:microsomal dipeptidase-like Zn-dependent dipeptidase